MSGDGESGRSKGLMKMVLWVGSVGKGARVRDWKGLGWCMWEEEKSAEKNKGEESEDGPIGGDFREFLKVGLREPMGRGEYLGCGGVWGDGAKDEDGKVQLGKQYCGEIEEVRVWGKE